MRRLHNALVITMPGGVLEISGDAASEVSQVAFVRWERLSSEARAQLVREGVVNVDGGKPGAMCRDAILDNLAMKMGGHARQSWSSWFALPIPNAPEGGGFFARMEADRGR